MKSFLKGDIDKAPLRRGYRCRCRHIDIDSYSGVLKEISKSVQVVLTIEAVRVLTLIFLK